MNMIVGSNYIILPFIIGLCYILLKSICVIVQDFKSDKKWEVIIDAIQEHDYILPYVPTRNYTSDDGKQIYNQIKKASNFISFETDN